MTDPHGELPPIHTWWPYLTISARHTVLESPRRPLETDVRDEVEQVTGSAVAAGCVLSEEDVQFVIAQIEQVD